MKTLTLANTLLVGLLVLGTFAASSRSEEPQAKKAQSDHEKIQGTWKPVSLISDGKEATKLEREEIRMTFSGNTMAMIGGKRTYKPKFSLDSTETPHQIDLTFRGEGGRTVVAKGIYRFEGNELTICAGEWKSGSPRPTEFENQVGDERSLMVLSRVVEGISALPSEPQKATTTQQSRELKVLQRFVGSWDWDFVVKSAEWAPENTKMKADVTVNWIVGGRVVEHKVVWQLDNVVALGLMTYDTENRVYQQWYFDSNGTIPRGENRGVWDEASKTFTWKSSIANGARSTSSHRFIDNDTLEFSLAHRDRAGNVVLHMEAKAKRK